MVKRNRGSIILLTVIIIAALLLSIIGATFALFTATVETIDGPKEVVTKSQVLEIMFNQKNEILYENLMPGRPGIESQAINENRNSVTFTVQSNDKVTLRTPYTVYFNITENTFEKSKNDSVYSNVVFLLKGDPGTCPKDKCTEENGYDLDSIIENSCDSKTILCGTGQYYDQFNWISHTFKEDSLPTKLGKIKAGQLGRVKVGSGVVGAYGALDTWQFEVWVNETGEEQNEDQGRVIRGYIEIDTDETVKYSNEPSQIKTP